jgi:hypothetical protein
VYLQIANYTTAGNKQRQLISNLFEDGSSSNYDGNGYFNQVPTSFSCKLFI